MAERGYPFGRVGLALALVCGSFVGCATGSGADPAAEDDESTGAGGASTASLNGSGGVGGAGGTKAWPCGIDCSTIATEACNQAVCDPASKTCQVAPASDGEICDDGLFCTIGETCQAGECSGGAPNDCGMSSPPCNDIVCNELQSMCSIMPAANGSSCVSTNLCHINVTCQSGVCIGQEKDCFFSPLPNECHIAICNPATGLCDPTPGNESKACVDTNDLCTEGKTCSSGNCIGGTPKNCDQLTQGCFNGTCDTSSGNCFQDPIPPGGSCLEATDDCNAGLCDAMGNCNGAPANEGGNCEDGDPCTSGETCTSGVCGGGMQVPQTIHYSEDFSDNIAGWQLGTEWQISAATSSSAHNYGGPDPDSDFSTTMDDGVAGAAIGGNISTSVHGYYYLTSPLYDTSQIQGSLWAGYRRWLNSDHLPYMQNSVEVYDGTTWITLWASGNSPGVQDSSWSSHAHDLAAYKSAQMRLRFGYKILKAGSYTVSGFNIDDVVIANVVCSL